MALIVENGTGVAGAESYGSVADVDAYWTARPHVPRAALWAALTTPQKEGALREATDWIDREFGHRFVGRKLSSAQALAWPRETGRLDDTGEPVPLTSGDGLVLEALPRQLFAAVADIAGSIPEGALTQVAAAEGVTSSKVGDVQTTFGAGASFSTGFRRNIGTVLTPLLIGGTPQPSWDWS